jgi:hypothetical protein
MMNGLHFRIVLHLIYAMRLKQQDIYQIDENSFGEFLIAVPDRGRAANGVTFEIAANDFFLVFGRSEKVHLPGVPESVLKKLAATPKILVLETDGKNPVRCYTCKRASA